MGCQLSKNFPKTKRGKFRILALHGRIISAREDMFVYARFAQLLRFINENINIKRKQTTEAFLNEKFIQISLCSKMPRHTVFNPR